MLERKVRESFPPIQLAHPKVDVDLGTLNYYDKKGDAFFEKLDVA